MSQAGALHILKKHEGSRRPSSWRTETITQSKEEAIEQIEEFRRQLAKIKEEYGHEEFHKKFMAIAEEESDCGSAKDGGNLGVFQKGQMQQSFEDATFGLQVGEMSEVVDSDSGIHVILRTH
mmetsp:Transcript_17489/g.29316  ORF Transcript_17489/g.29316 Transcript_17489/m.29316 type:complete len:122 (+) Transcript_17489:67-432(+)